MILTDVNVLIYAYDRGAKDHEAYRTWLEDTINGDQAYSMASLVLSGFLRIVTHPKILKSPSSIESALAFVHEITSRSNCVILNPGARHWQIFVSLCQEAQAKGNLVPDAYLAALAIESGCEWITTDRDFSRFPSLKWRHPLG